MDPKNNAVKKKSKEKTIGCLVFIFVIIAVVVYLWTQGIFITKKSPAVEAYQVEIKNLFEDYPAWGDVNKIATITDWAKGKRFQVASTKGLFLIYFLGDRIETVYIYHTDGKGRTEIYRYPSK